MGSSLARDELGSVVGVVPAAGRARRLGSPSASKELEPVYADPNRPGRVLPVCYRLLHAFREGGIDEAVVVTRSSKRDVRDRLGAGDSTTPALTHVELADSPSSAYTVAAGTRRAGDATIALGFPDVLWTGSRAFARLLSELAIRGSDAVLGMFPPAPDYPTHGVEVDDEALVTALHDPDPAARDRGRGRPAWTLAVWRAPFSRALEALVDRTYPTAIGEEADADELEAPSPEIGLTTAFREAIDAGFVVHGLEISDHPFLDVGDAARLANARRRAELPAP